MKPRSHRQTEFHTLSFYVLFVITKGKGIHTIDYKDYAYQKGTVFSLRKGVTHKFTKSTSEGELLVFTEDFILKHLGKTESLKTLQLFNELLESPKVQLNESMFLEVKTILNQIKAESKLEIDAYSSSIKRSLLHVLVSKLYREKTKDKDTFANSKYLDQFLKLQQLIQEQWFESKTVLHYAEQMSVTSKTLNNIVQSTIKKSVKWLLDDMITTQIKHLLINTDLSISEIAYESGYDDPTNFSKYFKKNTGFSPNQFREKHQ